jgi:UTP--glucose-1-phosphate uridylyltransferase
MKAILPAAGFGTRFLPITKVIPKEMLPLGAKPVIQFVVEEAVAAGFDELLIVINRDKELIRRYFEPAGDLEGHLEATGKGAAAKELRSLHEMARFRFVYQPEMRGLGDAIFCARDFAGDDPFAVLLADTVLHGESPLGAMLAAFEQVGHSAVALEPCPAERVGRYGIAGGTETLPGRFALDALIEKPAIQEAPRVGRLDGSTPHFAVAARYLFTPAIFDALGRCQPGKGGEIQLTDAMREVLETAGFSGIESPGKRLDIGNPAGLLAAQNLLAAGVGQKS